jgi:F-type H+-transporting ATPase subunit delta
MKFTSKQYAQALHDSLSETSPKDHDMVLDNFVKILAQNGDLGKYDEISSELKRFELEKKGIKEAEVTVAKEMEFNHQLVDELNKIAGNKIEITKKVDESLIGGVVVRIDDTLIDASIRTQLSNLNSQLKQ